jgi:hypothetical protein
MDIEKVIQFMKQNQIKMTDWMGMVLTDAEIRKVLEVGMDTPSDVDALKDILIDGFDRYGSLD